MIPTLSTIAPGRAPKPSFNSNIESDRSASASIANETAHNTTLRTQTFIVRGHDKHGQWKQMRVKAPDADGARYIAHQNETRAAECVQIETKI